jgi:DNA-binding CsgD family transcriptional regulator
MLVERVRTGRVNKLSDGQCDCLRLVAEHRSSKEIARLLGISPHTVDQRLKRATTILAVESRFEAARLFMNHERQCGHAGPVYDALVYQRPDLLQFGEFGEIGASASDQGSLGGGEGATLHEAQASYFSMSDAQARPSTLSSVFAYAGRDNELPVSWRLGVILAIMVLAIIGFALLVNVVEGISRIY